MESTGVYWIPLFELLETRGFTVLLVNARHYFGVSQYYRPIPELDDWLRRRIRMCYWKQWRLCRTKIRKAQGYAI